MSWCRTPQGAGNRRSRPCFSAQPGQALTLTSRRRDGRVGAEAAVEYDVVLDPFGRVRTARRGWERLREQNPRLGTPITDTPGRPTRGLGKDMTTWPQRCSGLGEAHGRRSSPPGRVADLEAAAMPVLIMARWGAARSAARGSGWTVDFRRPLLVRCGDQVPGDGCARPGRQRARGAIDSYRPYECRDGCGPRGELEPSSGRSEAAAWPRGLDEKQCGARAPRPRRRRAVLLERTRNE